MTDQTNKAGAIVEDANEAREVKLRKLRAELADREAKHEAAVKRRDEAIEMAMLPALFAAQDKHGTDNVKAVSCRDGFVIVKTPADVTFRKFADLGDAATSKDSFNLVKPCLVTPLEDFEALTKDQPAFLVDVANAVVSLGGVGRKKIEGK